MKFNKLSQLFLVSTIGLLVATLLTSCEITTIDYIFVACSSGSGTGSPGEIQTYDADSETGALRPGQPTVPSGGSAPVALAVTTDYQNLYVANQGNSSVAHFAIAGSGALTAKDSVTTDTTPVYLSVNAAGTFLYVVSGTSSATLTAYTLTSGTIGAVAAQIDLTVPGFASDVIIPTGVFALANNNAVYVSAYDQSAYNPGQSTPSTANPGWVFGFTVGSGGALTPVPGSPFKAGVKPSALVADPTNRFVYVTDFASNELIGYSIQAGYNLNFLINGPFKTASEPQAVVIDPRGIYIYVANALSNTVAAYVINLGTGTPSAVATTTGNGTNVTDTQPVAIIVDASLGRFVYTANELGNSVSGFELNPNTGGLTPTQVSPYPSGDQPTAIASVPHGNHSVQVVTP
ncbi:MAG: beta-propeller fold lactonase family protein [Terracidiphilus sp.]|jgi:6-phosphogluconolactonase (cycloisomerase 2 family)